MEDKMKKVISFSVFFIIIAIIVCFVILTKSTNSRKGGEGMFEKNSKYISLYKQNKLICNIKDNESQKLVELLKENNWDLLKREKRDDSYSIVLDFNNDICKLYIREKDRTCYLENDENQYELSDKVYTLILQYLTNN